MPSHPYSPFRRVSWNEYCEETAEDAFLASGMLSGKGEFRRLMNQGGLRIAGRVVRNPGRLMDLCDLRPPNELCGEWVAVLRAGKIRAGIIVDGGPKLDD